MNRPPVLASRSLLHGLLTDQTALFIPGATAGAAFDRVVIIADVESMTL